jgi:PAS domain S-box-containing protein
MNKKEINILKRAFDRERASRKLAEKILEEKSKELYQLNIKLEQSNITLTSLNNKVNSQLQGVFENLVDAYVEIDLNGNIVEMNNSAVDLLELKNLSDKVNVLSMVHPNDIEMVAPNFKELLKNGSITDFRVKIVTHNNKTKLVHINASSIYYNGIASGAQGILRDITIEDKYQKAIEGEKLKYENIIANMNLGLIEVNNHDEIIMANQSFLDMSGFKQSELVGKKCSEIFQLDAINSDKIHKTIDVRLEGESNSYELKVKIKSGETRHWLVSGAPNFDKKGNVIGSIGIHLDITEAKNNRELLEEQKMELDTIFSNVPMGIILGKNDKFIRTNSTFDELMGVKKEEVLGTSMEKFALASSSDKELLKKMNSGKLDHFAVNKRYLRKDGTVLWVKITLNAIKDFSGVTKYQLGLIEDITSERENTAIIKTIDRITKALLGKTNIYEIAWSIVGYIGDYLDTNDCIIYLVNKEKNVLEQIAVYGDKLGEDYGIKNKLDISISDGIVGTVVQSGISEIIKDTSKDPRYIVDDSIRLSEITVPIISNGEVIGIIDSEHKNKNHYSKEQAKILENIANLVAISLKTALNIRERETVELKNKELLKEWEKSNEALQEYAHIVSHDLKSPLRSIDALVNWLKEDNKDLFDENSLKNFELIETTLERMEQLISDVLHYSRVDIEASKKTDVDLNAIIEDIITVLYIPSHVSVKVNQVLPSIKGDKTKLQQVFLNLITNAIKFLDKSKGLIEIDFSNKENHYEFSVKDNGIGIDKKYHDKIFKIFHTLNRSKDSTGIGLSIVKKIVGLHGGDIWLESELKKGTTFYFTLKK